MSESEILYSLRGVTKAYNQRTVVDIPALDIRRGEILALVGPSGAGKSTLLRLLNFLELPTNGEISLDDFTLNGTSPPLDITRRVTTVFQRPILLNRSVMENVAYGLRLRGRRRVQAVVMAELARVGLSALAHAHARSLSGGEQQRVALARALAIRPTVLLLDEPTANLDPGNVALIEDIIRGVNREQRVTIVLVTHNVFQARRLAHRTAVMLDGNIIEIGATEILFTTPADPRSGAFLRGEMVY